MQNVTTSAAPQSSAMRGLACLGRFAVFFLTAGYAFPHVFVEGLPSPKLPEATPSNPREMK